MSPFQYPRVWCLLIEVVQFVFGLLSLCMNPHVVRGMCLHIDPLSIRHPEFDMLMKVTGSRSRYDFCLRSAFEVFEVERKVLAGLDPCSWALTLLTPLRSL